MVRSIVFGTACWISLALISACASTNSALPHGTAAYEVIPAPSVSTSAGNYRIGAFDIINIQTFQEEDLTLKDVEVDASGNILMPLIGSVKAAGRSSGELSADIEDRLKQRYLRNPQVTVSVKSSISQKVTVDGSVIESGVYELKGETTLLQALAMAKGANRTADVKHIAVFRTTGVDRRVGVFNVAMIRRGEMPDPLIMGNDVVVVPFSKSKGAFRDLLTALPGLGVFTIFRPTR